MSKKKPFLGYFFAAQEFTCFCDTWEEVQALQKKYSGPKTNKGYYSQEEGEQIKVEYLAKFQKAQKSKLTVCEDFSADGRCLDVFAAGVYEKGCYGGGFAVYEGSTLLHSGKHENIPNAAKGSGEWAGLLPAVVKALRWVKEQGAVTARIHTDQKVAAELIRGTYKAKKEFTQTFVEVMASLAGWTSFAPPLDESAKEAEGFQVAKALANEAAGLA